MIKLLICAIQSVFILDIAKFTISRYRLRDFLLAHFILFSNRNSYWDPVFTLWFFYVKLRYKINSWWLWWYRMIVTIAETLILLFLLGKLQVKWRLKIILKYYLLSRPNFQCHLLSIHFKSHLRIKNDINSPLVQFS